MSFLFDQNLSHRLPARLTDLFPRSVHVRAIGHDQAPDEWIWEYARTNGFCILTQDGDFAERSRLYGAPLAVVWLHCGNCTPQQVENLLRVNSALISELIRNPDLHCVEII